MQHSGQGNGASKNVEIPFRASAGGQRFEAVLRAVRTGGGLISSPKGLERGGLLVLQPAGADGVDNSMQLVSRVEGPTRVKGLFVLNWQKLVSPTGVSALLQFLSRALQTSVRSIDLPRNGSLDKEMAYYDFGRHQIVTPERAYHVTEAPAGANGAPAQMPARGSIKQAMEKVAESRSKPSRPAAKPRPDSTQEIVERDDGVVEMFGMKISKEAWERLDTFGGPAKRQK